MIKMILIAIYVLMILTVIFVERKSPTEALLWVLVLICLPYVGAILYLVFGSTASIKITAFVRGRRLEKRTHVIPPVHHESVSREHISDEDRQVISFNHTYNHSVLTCYNTASLYTDGESHYRNLFADIRNAKECIFVEFYTIHHDVMGESFVKILSEKAREGLVVLVMCDFVANLSTPYKMFAPLVKAGGQVIRVKPYFTHYRSHRKIVAIDHNIAYIGGMNIGKQYANMGKKKNPWRDTQVRMDGACVSELEDYFLTDWLSAVRRKKWDNTLSYVESITRPAYPDSGNLCQFIIGGADNNREAVKMCYLSMIRSAKKRIRIQTPYFIPDSSILDALKVAAAAGVEVEVMIPGIQSSFFLEPVTTYYCGQLLECGAKIYRYHGYVHAKTMVIDDELCCIGSVNMDMRSLMVDDEVCGVFYTNSLAEQYSTIYDRDIFNCDGYTLEEFRSRSGKERFLESIFLLFAPLM